jgi:hypothetical protein
LKGRGEEGQSKQGDWPHVEPRDSHSTAQDVWETEGR